MQQVHDLVHPRPRYVAEAGQLRLILDPPLPSPLLAAGAPVGKPASETLSVDAAKPLLAEALRQWIAAGANVSALHGIDLRIADLPSNLLGQAEGHTITLDDNAAGWGWFVDATPGNDSEFSTPGNQGEQDRMDLLSVVTHELGHVLGFDHVDDGAMAETLAAGTRRTGTECDQADAVDQVFELSADGQAQAWLDWWDAADGTGSRTRLAGRK